MINQSTPSLHQQIETTKLKTQQHDKLQIHNRTARFHSLIHR
jgi:hypothetical protein